MLILCVYGILSSDLEFLVFLIDVAIDNYKFVWFKSNLMCNLFLNPEEH